MYERKWILRLLAVTILAGIPLVKADLVQSKPNHSDVTGTHTYSAPPNFGFSSGGGSSFTQMSNQASSLSQDLNQAIEQLAASEAAPKGPRHFARKSNKECVNPAVEELSQTIQEVKNFVEQVNTQQPDNVNPSSW
ncbi:hypothetical protein Sta7437_2753 [Stanieria cyanosphaera PCC 7437]|uniref:Uncharacterized protein n=1 Tax=Stanieria cyanosphaera (strain ATCC 29371 / PCC 7437) TaxID=111780 RepID=K9XUR2_STAC7|nr:hypothetical protein [Stanieria cyanosphaera]AFZ36278.1 hypothetical protein Sta7437_2753 [Stanieria cyanosphaera PCC 7437]